MKKIIELLVKITRNISDLFNLFSIKLIDKFNINIFKPKKEEEIFENTEEIKKDVKKTLKNEKEIKKYKDREKIIRDIINRKIININNLNKISNSEYFIIIPKLHMEINKEIRRILFEDERGVFKNSIFKYFEEKNFINLGKQFSPIYLKSRDELKDNYRDIKIFKKILDEKMNSLLKKDIKLIEKQIRKNKKNEKVKEYFYDKNKLKDKKYLFFDFMIISSLNLNKENITLVDEKSKKEFLFKIVNQELQMANLKQIIIASGINFFLNAKYPQKIKEIIRKNEAEIKKSLNIQNFIGTINKEDLGNTLKSLLKEEYEDKYANEFMKIYNVIMGL